MPLPKLQLFRYPEVECISLGHRSFWNMKFSVWQVPNLAASSFDFSFEHAVQRLNRLPRMFTEPDGSFGWCGSFGEQAGEQIVDRVPCNNSTDSASQVLDSNISNVGSFSRPENNWQLFGMIYDRADRVVRVDMSGDCPKRQWLQLLDCFQPNGELVAFIVEAQSFVLARDLAHLLRN